MTGAISIGLEDIERWLELDEDSSKRARGRKGAEASPEVKPLRLTAEQRLGAARGLPPAIVKVVRGGSTGSVAQLKTQLAYLSREDELALKTDYGMVCDKREYLDAVLESWAVDFEATSWARKTTHLVVSTPMGTDPALLELAAERFCARLLGVEDSPGVAGERWQYLTVVHADTEYPHVHIVVNNRGLETGRQFEVHPAKDLNPQLLRTLWKEAAKVEGLELDDTPRRARGLPKTRERAPDWRRRQRGETSKHVRERADETLSRIRSGRPAPDREQAATARAAACVEAERREYRRIAERFDSAARETRDTEAARSAALLRGFAERLGQPWTRTRDAAARLMAALKGGRGLDAPSTLRTVEAAVTGPALKEARMADMSKSTPRDQPIDRRPERDRLATDRPPTSGATAAPAGLGPAEKAAAARARLAALSPGEREALAKIDADVERLLTSAGLDGADGVRSFTQPIGEVSRSNARTRQVERLQAAQKIDHGQAARRVDSAFDAARRIYEHIERETRARIEAERRKRQAEEARSKRRDAQPSSSPKRRR